MLDGLRMFGEAVTEFLNFQSIFAVLWSTQLGIIVGMLPGLTATMGVALMTTLTFKMDAGNAVLILVCMYVGAIYGGSRSAILLNIPGTPANAATAVDGYPLSKQGRAGEAIGIATTGSFIGSVIGMIFLALFTPLIGNVALKFLSFEFMWLAIFGVVICGNLTAPKDPLKGWVAGFLGLFVAMIGMEGIHAHVRFAFGSVALSGGIGLIPAMVGAFGFAELMTVMKHPEYEVVKTKIERVIPRLKDIYRYRKTIIRSGIVGTFIGAVPGVGEDIAAWVSYDMAKRSSPDGDKFGTGVVEGLIAAEAGNNACVAGAMIPVLALAIPGSAPAAVLLAAMFIHGIRPGPLIMIEFPNFVYSVVAMVMFASSAMLVLGLAMVKTADQGAAGTAAETDAHRVRSLRRRCIRHYRQNIRRRGNGHLRYYRLLYARNGLSRRAPCSWHHPGRYPGQEPAPRADTLRRQPAALLYPAHFGRALYHYPSYHTQ